MQIECYVLKTLVILWLILLKSIFFNSTIIIKEIISIMVFDNPLTIYKTNNILRVLQMYKNSNLKCQIVFSSNLAEMDRDII